jgi:glycosyltransferase involved in cell wall biosynthesis
MKVLVAAIACSPSGASEEFLGWQAVRAISRKHRVWVLTAPRHRPSIERAQAEGIVRGVQFHYVGGFARWPRNPSLFRLQAWLEYVHWSRLILSKANELHARYAFDLTHHITYSAWRVPSPLWRLNVPFIWGPIGGGGRMPLRFFGSLSIAGIAFEALRGLSQVAARLRGPRRCAREAAWILASNSETADLLRTMRGSADAVSAMWPTYFPANRIAEFRRRTKVRKTDGILRLFAGGTAIGSKGLALALRGLRIAAERGVRFKYTIAGYGPEHSYLCRLSKKLGIEEHVRFIPPLAGTDYFNELAASDCFLLPSFRENLGITMLEAMIAEAVPIVADISAPGEIVTANCGIKLPLTSASDMVWAIADAIEWLAANPDRKLVLAAKARVRALQVVSREEYEMRIENVYQVARARSVVVAGTVTSSRVPPYPFAHVGAGERALRDLLAGGRFIPLYFRADRNPSRIRQ